MRLIGVWVWVCCGYGGVLGVQVCGRCFFCLVGLGSVMVLGCVGLELVAALCYFGLVLVLLRVWDLLCLFVLVRGFVCVWSVYTCCVILFVGMRILFVF